MVQRCFGSVGKRKKSAMLEFSSSFLNPLSSSNLFPHEIPFARKSAAPPPPSSTRSFLSLSYPLSDVPLYFMSENGCPILLLSLNLYLLDQCSSSF